MLQLQIQINFDNKNLLVRLFDQSNAMKLNWCRNRAN